MIFSEIYKQIQNSMEPRNKFRVGDVVKRTGRDNVYVKQGDIVTVSDIVDEDTIRLENLQGMYNTDNFVLYNYNKKDKKIPKSDTKCYMCGEEYASVVTDTNHKFDVCITTPDGDIATVCLQCFMEVVNG